METASKILQELVVVHADYDVWSGEVRLAEADIKLGVGGELPPDRVAKLGSKSICDPRALKVFRSLKGATRRMLQGYGLPFLTGWAIPRARLGEVLQRLDADRQKFNQAKQAFLGGYEASIEAWIAANPGYEQAIRSAVLEREDVARRLDFTYQVFHIQPVSGEPAAEQRLTEQASGLAGALLREIEQDAQVFYERYLRGRAEVRAYTRRSLLSLAAKVDGLSFLSSLFGPLVALLRDTARGYAQHAVHGRIGAPFFFQIHSAVLILMDAQRMREYAAGHGLEEEPPYPPLPEEQDGATTLSARCAPVVSAVAAAHAQPVPGTTLPLDLDALLGDFESFVSGAGNPPDLPHTGPDQACVLLSLDEDAYF